MPPIIQFLLAQDLILKFLQLLWSSIEIAAGPWKNPQVLFILSNESVDCCISYPQLFRCNWYFNIPDSVLPNRTKDTSYYPSLLGGIEQPRHQQVLRNSRDPLRWLIWPLVMIIYGTMLLQWLHQLLAVIMLFFLRQDRAEVVTSTWFIYLKHGSTF